MSTNTVPSPAILLACSVAFIIVQLDVTIVNVALPQIGRDLNAGLSALRWVVDAYTLGFAVCLLSAGVLADKFGARRVFLCGFVLFALASLACAAASGSTVLNLARAAQGVGAAMLVPSSLAILHSLHCVSIQMPHAPFISFAVTTIVNPCRRQMNRRHLNPPSIKEPP